jgi:hypothetical protein
MRPFLFCIGRSGAILNTTCGFSQADITPLNPVELVGFDRVDNTSRGVRDPLLLQIAVWQTPDQSLSVLAAIDAIGFTVQIAWRCRQVIGQALGISPAAVMLCFSHTHAGPDAAGEPAYLDNLLVKAAAAAKDAFKNRRAVQMAWARTEVEIGVNRRAADGAVDRRVSGMVFFDAASGQRKLICLRVSAHANVLSSDNYLLSADYFGTLRDRLSAEYGCPVMITQGAAGNIRPKFQQSDAEMLEIQAYLCSQRPVDEKVEQQRRRESQAALEKMADTLCQALTPVIKQLSPEPIKCLRMVSRTIRLYSPVPDEKTAQAIAAEAWAQAHIQGKGWLAEIDRLRQLEILEQQQEIEVQMLLVNHGGWAGVPLEIMAEIALAVNSKINTTRLHLGGYTNGCTNYFPDELEYRKGGFEVLWSLLIYYRYHGQVMPFYPDSAEKLEQFVAEMWKDPSCNN